MRSIRIFRLSGVLVKIPIVKKIQLRQGIEFFISLGETDFSKMSFFILFRYANDCQQDYIIKRFLTTVSSCFVRRFVSLVVKRVISVVYGNKHALSYFCYQQWFSHRIVEYVFSMYVLYYFRIVQSTQNACQRSNYYGSIKIICTGRF